ncbi:hypothetical protein ABZ802_32765 [Streptomyces sp. NPDC047737]
MCTDEFVEAGGDFIRREPADVIAVHPALTVNRATRQLADEAGRTLG